MSDYIFTDAFAAHLSGVGFGSALGYGVGYVLAPQRPELAFVGMVFLVVVMSMMAWYIEVKGKTHE